MIKNTIILILSKHVRLSLRSAMFRLIDSTNARDNECMEEVAARVFCHCISLWWILWWSLKERLHYEAVSCHKWVDDTCSYVRWGHCRILDSSANKRKLKSFIVGHNNLVTMVVIKSFLLPFFISRSSLPSCSTTTHYT